MTHLSLGLRIASLVFAAVLPQPGSAASDVGTARVDAIYPDI